MKIKNLLILSIITLNFVSLKAFIVRLEALQNPTNNQYVINAGDAHFGSCSDDIYKHPTLSNSEIAEVNKNQAKQLINFSKHCKAQDCLFVIEDLYNYTGKSKKIAKNFNQTRIDNEKENLTNCMSYINDLCQSNEIDIVNIEFRQSKTLFFDSLEAPASVFINDFNNIIDEIRNYDDGKTANQHYSKILNRVLKKNKKLLNTLAKNKNLYFNQINDQITETDLDKFNEDICDLIDIKIIHSILKNKNKKFIFICAGDTHIQKINKILEKINYQTNSDSKEFNVYSPINLQKCLNKLKITNSQGQIEFPNIYILIIVILLLSIKFPRRFKILHLHFLKSNTKVEQL